MTAILSVLDGAGAVELARDTVVVSRGTEALFLFDDVDVSVQVDHVLPDGVGMVLAARLLGREAQFGEGLDAEAGAAGHLVQRVGLASPAEHLRQPRDSRLDLVPQHVARYP